MEQGKIKRKNPLIRGWDTIKKWWSGGLKGKVGVIFATIICVFFTQAMYIAIDIITNDETMVDNNEIIRSDDYNDELNYDQTEFIRSEIEKLYTDLDSKVLDINVISINFESLQSLFDKGTFNNGMYELYDSGVVEVEYMDGTKISKGYTLEYRINFDTGYVESKLIIDGVIDTRKNSDEILKIQEQQRIKQNEQMQDQFNQDNSQYFDNNSGGVENGNELGNNISIDKYLYKDEVESLIENLVTQEIMKLENANRVGAIEFLSDGSSYVGNGYQNGEILELDSSFFYNYNWSDGEIKDMIRQGGFTIKFKYNVVKKVVVESNIKINISL